MKVISTPCNWNCTVKALIFGWCNTLSKTSQTVFKPSVIKLNLTFMQQGHGNFYLYIPRANKCVSSSVELLCGLAMLAYVPAVYNLHAQQVKPSPFAPYCCFLSLHSRSRLLKTWKRFIRNRCRSAIMLHLQRGRKRRHSFLPLLFHLLFSISFHSANISPSQ